MYKVNVNNAFDFEVSEEKLKSLDIIETKPNTFHCIDGQRSISAEIKNAAFLKKSYMVEVNSNLYRVTIQDALDQQIKAMGFEIGASKKVNEILAPMPGLILEINVEVGKEVKENDPLLILEAMKMENSLASPRNGIIKSVNVKQGETVNKNAILIEFE